MADPAVPMPKANMGQPAARIDGRQKVTGAARYASDFAVSNPAFAFLVTSAIARGRISGIDLSAANDVDGILTILTHENAANEIKKVEFFANGGPASETIVPLAGPEVWHDGQIIAVVVASTFEAAREAAYRTRFTYSAEEPSATFDSAGSTVVAAKEVAKKHEDPQVGDAEGAFRVAEVTLDARYGTPTQHHNPIELFTTTCEWNGPRLTIYEGSQYVHGLKNGVAAQLGMDPANVHVINPYVGGAFGSRGSMTQRTALAALAARRVGRPVKLVVTRDQGFTIGTYRAETRHHIRLGASRDGKLTALLHEGWEVTSRPDAYKVAGTDASSRMYACPNVWTKVNLVQTDRNTPGFMRSPPEVPYIYALECAIDELAVALAMDPIELRRINDTKVEPIKGLPYTSRSLMPCFDAAAKEFGWSERRPEPMAMRDGDWLIGYGCAMATYPSHIAPAAARVRANADGRVRVQTAAHEIGTGAYTVIAQAAATRLGVPIENVTVELGDSALPPVTVAGGSHSTASVTMAVATACDAMRAKLSTGSLGIGGVDLVEGLKRLNVGALEEYGEWKPDGVPPTALQDLYRGKVNITGGTRLKDRIQFAFGAEFVEVRVHARTREIRVPRIVGAFAAGHIVNPRTARSQLMGGMIWGIGSALHEATELDEGAARYINDNLADYLIAVNADVAELKVILVPEEDDRVNPAGIKGVGELGNVGTAAAIANAVFHATGKRIRQLPIRLEKLLAA
jgi:xanthine dehydrogenase YagR molybdenum-binding subunit